MIMFQEVAISWAGSRPDLEPACILTARPASAQFTSLADLARLLRGDDHGECHLCRALALPNAGSSDLEVRANVDCLDEIHWNAARAASWSGDNVRRCGMAALSATITVTRAGFRRQTSLERAVHDNQVETPGEPGSSGMRTPGIRPQSGC